MDIEETVRIWIKEGSEDLQEYWAEIDGKKPHLKTRISRIRMAREGSGPNDDLLEKRLRELVRKARNVTPESLRRRSVFRSKQQNVAGTRKALWNGAE